MNNFLDWLEENNFLEKLAEEIKNLKSLNYQDLLKSIKDRNQKSDDIKPKRSLESEFPGLSKKRYNLNNNQEDGPKWIG